MGTCVRSNVPEVADLEGLAPRELASLLVEVDGARRRLEALLAEMVGLAERTVAYAEDGHASVTGWAKPTCNWSSSETKAIVQTARLFHSVPEAKHGYTTRRDPDGHWHTHRPDGTEIGWLATAPRDDPSSATAA
jgi:hypothetical protein